MSKAYFNLSEGGAGILQAASRIYAAYVTSGRVPEGQEKEWMRRALKHAMSFAKTIDDLDESPKEAARSAPFVAGSAIAAEPDHATAPKDSVGPVDASDTIDTASTDDSGIELTAATDEGTIDEDEALAAIMDDQTASVTASASADPPTEMKDELPQATVGAPTLDANDSEDADKPLVAEGPGDTDSAEDAGVKSTAASDNDLELDDDVLSAFADKPLDSDDSTPGAADESESAIEFLSAMADELPPSTDESADMDDIMSALMDDAAEPAGAADAARREPPLEVASIPDGDSSSDDDAGDTEASDASTGSDQQAKAGIDQPAKTDEQISPTEADLANTHLDDDLSFELVDEDIDMNKLIEDAVSAAEKKEDQR